MQTYAKTTPGASAPGFTLLHIVAQLRVLEELFDHRDASDEGMIVGDLAERLERAAAEIGRRAAAAGLDETTLLPVGASQ